RQRNADLPLSRDRGGVRLWDGVGAPHAAPERRVVLSVAAVAVVDDPCTTSRRGEKVEVQIERIGRTLPCKLCHARAADGFEAGCVVREEDRVPTHLEEDVPRHT